jgi:hypothetical protein
MAGDNRSSQGAVELAETTLLVAIGVRGAGLLRRALSAQLATAVVAPIDRLNAILCSALGIDRYFVQSGKNHTRTKNKYRPSPLAWVSAQKIGGGLCYGALSRWRGNECRK